MQISLPTTTDTGRLFAHLANADQSDPFLSSLQEMAEKEHWLIAENQLEVHLSSNILEFHSNVTQLTRNSLKCHEICSKFTHISLKLLKFHATIRIVA